MILSDFELECYCHPNRELPLVIPFKREHLQPSSIDLTLDDIFLTHKDLPTLIDLGDVIHTTEYETHEGEYILNPQQFVLGSTAERIQVPTDCVGIINGKSSIARLGVFIHICAGYCDPGFCGKVTLEIYNANHRAVILRPGLPICQVSFEKTLNPVLRPYGHPDLNSKYQDQKTTTGSLYSG